MTERLVSAADNDRILCARLVAFLSPSFALSILEREENTRFFVFSRKRKERESENRGKEGRERGADPDAKSFYFFRRGWQGSELNRKPRAEAENRRAPIPIR